MAKNREQYPGQDSLFPNPDEEKHEEAVEKSIEERLEERSKQIREEEERLEAAKISNLPHEDLIAERDQLHEEIENLKSKGVERSYMVTKLKVYDDEIDRRRHVRMIQEARQELEQRDNEKAGETGG